MNDPVRVELENGSKTTVERSYAEAKGLKVLAGEGAVGANGRPLPESGRVDDMAVARANARLATEQRAARSQSAKKAAAKRGNSAAKKAAAKKTTAGNGPADSASGESGAGEGNQS